MNTKLFYPNYFAVGNLIYSLYKNRYLDPKPSKNGYRQVTVYDQNKVAHTMNYARILLLLSRPVLNPEELEVDHINGIKTDDRLENLLWVTKSENNKKRKPHKRPNRNKRILIVLDSTGERLILQNNREIFSDVPDVTLKTLASAREGSHHSPKWEFSCYYLEWNDSPEDSKFERWLRNKDDGNKTYKELVKLIQD